MTKEHAPTGITDEAADEVHDFMENTESQEHKAHPDLQLDRGEHIEGTDTSKGLESQKGDEAGSKTQQAKSKVESVKEGVKETLHLKK